MYNYIQFAKDVLLRYYEPSPGITNKIFALFSEMEKDAAKQGFMHFPLDRTPTTRISLALFRPNPELADYCEYSLELPPTEDPRTPIDPRMTALMPFETKVDRDTLNGIPGLGVGYLGPNKAEFIWCNRPYTPETMFAVYKLLTYGFCDPEDLSWIVDFEYLENEIGAECYSRLAKRFTLPATSAIITND